jgi:hypothetical protein
MSAWEVFLSSLFKAEFDPFSDEELARLVESDEDFARLVSQYAEHGLRPPWWLFVPPPPSPPEMLADQETRSDEEWDAKYDVAPRSPPRGL